MAVPNKEEREILQHFDGLIKNSEALKELQKSAGWKIFSQALLAIRTEALERVLAGTSQGESRESLIGFAKATNYIFNFVSSIIQDGENAVLQKSEALYRLNEADDHTRSQRKRRRPKGGNL